MIQIDALSHVCMNHKAKFSITILNAVPQVAIPLSSLIILTTLSLAKPLSPANTSRNTPSNPTHCDSTIINILSQKQTHQ